MGIRPKKINGLSQYSKEQDGTTAVEFALIGIPFFMLMLGIIELSLFYASGVAVEGAANSASRVIRTGQAQLSADPQATFEQSLCAGVGVLVNCNALTYETLNFNESFAGVEDAAAQFDEDGNMVSSGFDAGGIEDVIMVRVSYRHFFLTPFIGALLDDGTGTNSAQHLTTVVLRTEPYDFN